jgi:hypothetical protein
MDKINKAILMIENFKKRCVNARQRKYIIAPIGNSPNRKYYRRH